MSSWISRKATTCTRKFPNEVTHTTIHLLPTFHILISTAGRPALRRMLDSLRNELTKNDAITIVFDGENALQQSGFCEDWIRGHLSTIHVVEQQPNLGFWGHGVRNKYQSMLETRTTFVMNADDDDEYIPGSFQKLRLLCKHDHTLYIAKFIVKKPRSDVIVPSQFNSITKNNIGTPCGIIPFNIAGQSSWELCYGGDFSYYEHLQTKVQDIQFLNVIIYRVVHESHA